MNQFKYLLVYLLIALTVFFNIERLDFGYENAINIHTAVYIIGLIAVLAVILLPAFYRHSLIWPMVIWQIVYLVFKIVSAEPIVGNGYIYLTVTEISFLALLVWLAYKVARRIHEFTESVQIITLADVGQHLSSLDAADGRIRMEIKRSRHYERPLSVIVVEPEAHSMNEALNGMVQEAQQTILDRYAMARLAQVMRQQLRLMDMVFEDKENGRLIILSPEANQTDSTVLARWVKAVTVEQLQVKVNCAAATFPDDGLTFNKLMQEAVTKLSGAVLPLSGKQRNEEEAVIPAVVREGGQI